MRTLDALQWMARLEVLDAARNVLVDLRSLERLPALQRLDVRGNPAAGAPEVPRDRLMTLPAAGHPGAEAATK